MNVRALAACLVAVLALAACEGVQIVIGPHGGPTGPTGAPGTPGTPGTPGEPGDAGPPPSAPPTGLPPGGEYGPSLQGLDDMASRMLAAGALGTGLRGSIVDDAQKSGGVAAIAYRGSDSIIYVHPQRRREWSTNTWAFIIGHELSHALLRHSRGGPEAEAEADAQGAALATKAGHDVSGYIAFICSSQPNSCSPSHGCFHDRMRRLEEQFDVSACGSAESAHAGHAMATGLSALGEPPPSWNGSCILEMP